MAQCVQIAQVPIPDYGSVAVLQPYDTAAVDECYGYWMLDPAEYTGVLGVLAASPGTGASAPSSDPFALPPTADIAAAWGVGFVLVVGCYVIARMAGAVVNFIK